MKRKHFVELASALVTLGAARGSGQEASPQPSERWQKMHQAWITSLMEGLDANVDDPTRTRLMLSAGRACARRSGILTQAQAAKGDVDKLVATLARHIGKDNARREGNVIHL